MKIHSITAVALLVTAGTLANAEVAFAVTKNQSLISFDTDAPNAILTGAAISGLQQNEQIRGIDFRPANGQLYAMGSFNNLYTIDTTTGSASLVGSGAGIAFNGSSFGFDFNPVIDRIRVVSDAGQNYVFNPNDGTAVQVTDLFYGAGDANEGVTPNIVSSAYTNSFTGTTSTQLYGIDTGLDILVTQANSAGTLGTVGSLGADIVDMVGFDISSISNMGFSVSIEDGGTRSVLWGIDLNTGAATEIGEIGGGSILTSFAIVPAPGAVAMLSMAGLVGSRRRR